MKVIGDWRSGSALGSGSRGREFESHIPDQINGLPVYIAYVIILLTIISFKKTMLELLKKTAFISLGLAAMSVATIQRLGKKIAEEGELSEEEGEKLVHDLLEQSKKSKIELKKNIEKTVKKSLLEMDIATSKDINSINKRLDVIENTLSKNVKKTPKKTKA